MYTLIDPVFLVGGKYIIYQRDVFLANGLFLSSRKHDSTTSTEVAPEWKKMKCVAQRVNEDAQTICHLFTTPEVQK